MPYCAILECKNDSRRKNLLNGGVSYHRFPKDVTIKEKWIRATGRADWMPVKSSTICSEHFIEKDFLISKTGRRYLKTTSIPTIKFLMFYDHEQNVSDVASGPSKRQISESCDSKPLNPQKKTRLHESSMDTVKVISDFSQKEEDKNYNEPHSTIRIIPSQLKTAKEEDASSSSAFSTPRKRKLKGQLRWAQEKIKKQNLKVKRLQTQNRRIKRKITNIEDMLKTLEKKFLMAKENLDCLTNTNVEVQELIARNTAAGVVSKKKYSPALRSFALTLHYYSPRAYDYVRRTFNTSLPHPRTLKNWYSKVGGEPGFTKESFSALKQKADSSSQPLLATLVLDEMSIRRRVEWDGRKFHGYVDMGAGLEGDHLAEAKEALVFMVTAINSNFKVPVAFFLVDGVSGLQRADLVKLCLELTHDAGIRIVALTFDGCAANVSMAKHLGCSFETENVMFKHPITNDSIVAILDPCHMIKLLRNAFEEYKTLVDNDGNKIQWQHVVELNKLQYEETFHLSNKLRNRHINFQNERMKVKLATQLFSLSVAEAIKFCRDSGMSQFYESEPTEKFLIICNNLFDIFNSRNLHSYGFKKALNAKNATQIFEFLNEASNYIRGLKMENGTLVIKCRRKTGFLGFLGCIEALKYLHESLIETDILVYLPFYKMSQDHLELFFCNIRAQGGSNNNPTARQFISAYKKILVHVQLRDSNKGNCTALEEICILNCSSAVERINKSMAQDVLTDETEDDSEIEELGNFFSDFSNQAIGHIAGYIIRVLLKRIHCDICVSSLVTHHYESFHRFIVAKDQGGLLYPSADVVNICQVTETFLKSCDLGMESGIFKKDVAMSKIMRQFIGRNLFVDIAYHQLGEFPMSNHVTDLIKAIVEKYMNVRMHHLLKLKIKPSKRQFLNKYVLFQGQ